MSPPPRRLTARVCRQQGPAFVDRPTDLERHWTLLKQALTYMEERGQLADCVDLIMRAKGSREFGQRPDICKVRPRHGVRDGSQTLFGQ